jgi:hypothetical protein
MSKLKKWLIALAAFFGFIAIAFLTLFLLTKFYLSEKYTISYTEDGSFKLVEKAEPAFGELIICESIDNDTFEPVSTRQEFEIGFREIYATIQASDVSSIDTFTYKWKNLDSGEVLRDFSFNYFKDGGYIPDFIVLQEGEDILDYHLFSEPGKYRVEYYHNNMFVDSADFSIVTPEVTSEGQTSEITFKDHIVFEGMSYLSRDILSSKAAFSQNSQYLYTAVYVEGYVNPEDTWNFKLLEKESGGIIRDYTYKYSDIIDSQYISDYLYYCLSCTSSEDVVNLGPGDYVVKFYHNKNLESSVDFSISSIPVDFGYLTICNDIDENDAPVDIGYEFPLDTRQVCATIYVGGADLEDECEFILFSHEQDKILRQYKFKYEDNWDNNSDLYDGYFAICFVSPGDESLDESEIFGVPGEYYISFKHNGEFVSEALYYIVD